LIFGPQRENQHGDKIQDGGQNGCQLFLTSENQFFQCFFLYLKWC